MLRGPFALVRSGGGPAGVLGAGSPPLAPGPAAPASCSSQPLWWGGPLGAALILIPAGGLRRLRGGPRLAALAAPAPCPCGFGGRRLPPPCAACRVGGPPRGVLLLAGGRFGGPGVPAPGAFWAVGAFPAPRASFFGPPAPPAPVQNSVPRVARCFAPWAASRARGAAGSLWDLPASPPPRRPAGAPGERVAVAMGPRNRGPLFPGAARGALRP